MVLQIVYRRVWSVIWKYQEDGYSIQNLKGVPKSCEWRPVTNVLTKKGPVVNNRVVY